MSWKDPIKHLLKVLGHALGLSLHDRFDVVDYQIGQIRQQLDELKAESHSRAAEFESCLENLAEADGALLRGSIRSLEEIRELRAESKTLSSESKLRINDLRNIVNDLARASREHAAEVGGRHNEIRFTLSGLVQNLDEARLESRERIQAVSARLSDFIRNLEDVRKDSRLRADALSAQIDAAAAQIDSISESVVGVSARLQAGSEQLSGFVQTVNHNIKKGRHESRQQIESLGAHLSGFSSALGAVSSHSANLSAGVANLSADLTSLSSAVAALEPNTRAALESLLTRLQELFQDLKGAAAGRDQLVDAVSRFQASLNWVLDHEVVRQVCIESGDYESYSPEIGLMRFLYSFLPGRKALDIGANVGEVSESLLKTGYEVYAFEPQPQVFSQLEQRLKGNPAFHPFPFALGSSPGDATLHTVVDLSAAHGYGDPSVYASLVTHSMPDDLPFQGKLSVPVKTLAELHRSRVIPEDISLVKIDTEGFDLEVIRGMGKHRYPVVVSEFWDESIPFAQSGILYTLDKLIEEMRRRDYFWHIVLYRTWGKYETAFYCNHPHATPHAWGNVVFFQDYDLFSHAQAWCSAALPRTYFKPAPGPQSASS